MKKLNKLFLGSMAAAASVCAFAAYAATPNANDILMTVDGQPVTVNEFEYLYNKNNSQQTTQQTVDEYLKMFVDFKLKVAEARNQGLDTTQAFVSEFNTYRDDLAKPYMRAQEVEDSLVQVAYDHMLEDVRVRHIMFSRARNPQQNREQLAMIDSIRTALIDGTADWDSVSIQYSIDNTVKYRGGDMGWITGGRLPYPFEDAAFNTPQGEISQPVNSGFGLHLVKVEGRRPTRGEVKVAHILKLTRGLNMDQQFAAKRQIDSIYNLIKNHDGDFAELAKAESQDPGSAMKGGELEWFGTGQMVADFDSVAFSLKKGEISKPFLSSFGWHIIMCQDHRPGPSLDDARASILDRIKNDERSAMPHRRVLDQLANRYDARIDSRTMDNFVQTVEKNNGLDSIKLEQMMASNKNLVKVNGKNITLGSVLSQNMNNFYAHQFENYPANAQEILTDMAKQQIDKEVTALYLDELYATNSDYANLLNEYHDGILLYEISNDNVWEKASHDTEGLAKYFNSHRGNYKWDKPRYKGLVVFADSDSLLAEVREYIDVNNLAQNPDQLIKDVHSQFGKSAKVQRVLASKGENKIIDYLAFGGDKPEAHGKWAYYFDVNGHVAGQPEEYIDVLGAVTTDYQNELQEQWIEQLRNKYVVKINDAVLKQLKAK